jgi:hypothetical protein
MTETIPRRLTRPTDRSTFDGIDAQGFCVLAR